MVRKVLGDTGNIGREFVERGWQSKLWETFICDKGKTEKLSLSLKTVKVIGQSRYFLVRLLTTDSLTILLCVSD